MYLYYVLTPLNVALVGTPLAIFPDYFNNTIISEYTLEKTSFFKPTLAIQATEFQANHYEVLGLDMMYSLSFAYFKILSFSYFKLLPVLMTIKNQENIYCNADFSAKTDWLNAVEIEAMQYYEAYSSFTDCQIVDYFTMKCTKCTNGKNPTTQCSNCATE